MGNLKVLRESRKVFKLSGDAFNYAIDRLHISEVLAKMHGYDGFPSAQYTRWLIKSKSSRFFIVSVEQDWYDVVNENGDVEYNEDWVARVEKVSYKEAKGLMWDKIIVPF